MIPRIIHQIWSSKNKPMPALFMEFSKTWIDLHPDWQYIMWNDAKIEHFLQSNFPKYIEAFQSFPYDIQRWDTIRYLFLYKMGGLYVDMDYECMEPLDSLLNGHSCCMGLEPAEHARPFNMPYIVGNALMATIPGHRFLRMIIDDVFEKQTEFLVMSKSRRVIETTGPLMATRIYNSYPFKDEITLLSAEQVAPLTMEEVRHLINGNETVEMAEKIEKALALHYFLGTWYSHI